MNGNTEIKGFRNAYDNLPCKEQRLVRQELMESLGWKIARFYSRMRGESFVRTEEIESIEKVFNSHGVEAWTGERL